MANSQLTLILEQYKQFRANLKRLVSAIVLDTITTRFMLLFLFLLAIPLITVIIFTTSLLANHIHEATSNQLLISRNLLDGALEAQREKLYLMTHLKGGQNAEKLTCPEMGLQCALLDNSRKEALLSGLQPIPLNQFLNMREFDNQTLLLTVSQPYFYTILNDGLTLWMAQTGQKFAKNVSILHGTNLDTAFMNRLFREHSNLQTEIWIIREAPTAQQPAILSRFYHKNNAVPTDMLLNRLQSQPFQQGQFEVDIGKSSYQIYQQPVYSINHTPLARIVHILPLSQNQLILNNYYLGIYIITVASIIFSVLLALGAGRTITQPLLQLIQQVNQISRENVLKDGNEILVTGVHEINQLVGAFNRMIARLRQEHKMKDEFVATLTHDLKVPLLAEKQTLSYLKSSTYGPLTDEQTEVLGILQSSNRSCLSLVNGLLEVYRYESGEVALMFESFSMASLLQETMGELQTLAHEKSIELRLRADMPESNDIDQTLVYADRLEIKRVLHNLMNNAIINTPTRGFIECCLTDSKNHGSDTIYKFSGFQHTTLKAPVILKDRLLVAIKDSGVGFTAEDMPFLFKQFAVSRGRNPMSTGLGLYNCHQVIQAHQGLLWVESTEGEGSSVCFILPVNLQASQERRFFRDRRKTS